MLRVAVLSSLFLLVAACASVRTLERGSDTRQLSEDETRLWYAADEFDQAIRKRGALYPDPALRAYVQGIAERLYPEFADVLALRVVDSSQMNAFALPNGSIYLNLGLIARVRNEAQLATVIAHEVSHFKFQHGLKKRRSADGLILAGWAVSLASGIPLSGELLTLGALSGYSQDAEREADREGFKRLVERGYDVSQAAAVFEIMRAEADALEIERPWFYVSHPKLSERIESMRRLANAHPVADGQRDSEAFQRWMPLLRGHLLRQLLSERAYKALLHILGDETTKALYPPEADYYLAEAYRLRGEEGDSAKAEAAYRRAIAQAPGFAPSYRGLGTLSMRRGRLGAAARLFSRYLSLAPDAGDSAYVRRYLKRCNATAN